MPQHVDVSRGVLPPQESPKEMDWTEALAAWSQTFPDLPHPTDGREGRLPSFRVACDRCVRWCWLDIGNTTHSYKHTHVHVSTARTHGDITTRSSFW